MAYRYYVENAAAHPAIIGVHWFEWLDEPNTGRFDGENYNIGMVDVADQPYAELVDAMKTTHARLLTVHNGKERPVGAEGTCEIKRSLLFEHSRDVVRLRAEFELPRRQHSWGGRISDTSGNDELLQTRMPCSRGFRDS